jgi:hypothetical protein
MKAFAVLLASALGFAVAMAPTDSVAQQGKGGGNSAKSQACRAEASQMVRGSSGKGAGGNIEAAKAQARVYYQQCMAR